jgi:hypothetical protein
MFDWISIDHWAECASMERSGIVFEIRNAHGQTLFTACVPEVPNAPFDWTGPPIEFRAVPQPPIRHSSPLPGATDQ